MDFESSKSTIIDVSNGLKAPKKHVRKKSSFSYEKLPTKTEIPILPLSHTD